jgi:DNA-binding CsgD family transcriptional regulator
VQKRFAASIKTINRDFREEIASTFLITLGDEFQGLLVSPAESFRLVRRLEELMDPVPFSFGVGVGTLSTPLEKQAVGMDGEAFHRARSSLDRAKKSKRGLLYSFDSPSLDLVNALVGLLEDRWRGLTPRQKQVRNLLRDLKGQQAVAKRLRISQPAVSKVVSSLRHFTEAERVLNEFLRGVQAVDSK